MAIEKFISKRAPHYKDIPDEKRDVFRKKNLSVMPLLNINTFNGRSVILFISVLFNIIWL